jgi:triosephosphate isomerase (TIM)
MIAKDNRIIIANWKMNLNLAETRALSQNMAAKFKDFNEGTVVVCPNQISLQEVSGIIKDSPLKLGSQHVFWESKGAYTGEISTEMLMEAGCEYVIIGHSERRKYVLENYEMVNKMVKAVINTEKLVPVVCIGENWDERKTDKVDFVLVDQLQQALGGVNVVGSQQIIIAYEPIWAIGSGNAMEPSEAEYSHKIIKLALNGMFGMPTVNRCFRIIYGGSINSSIAKDFTNIDYLDGLLVGGASLDADGFYDVAKIIL